MSVTSNETSWWDRLALALGRSLERRYSRSEERRATSTADSASDVTGYISNLQKDGRLLLRHIARRSDTALPDRVPAGACPDGHPSDALFAQADAIVGDSAKLADLVCTVDTLSRSAAPANVRSIRLTSAYLHIAVEGGEPPGDISSEARQLKRCMRVVVFIALTVFALSVGLLAHMEHGRRLLQQLNTLRQQEQVIIGAVSTLPLTESVPRSMPGGHADPASSSNEDAALQLCRPPLKAGNSAASETIRWREPMTQKAASLCRQVDDSRVRLGLTYASLSAWNCRTNLIFFPLEWGSASCLQAPYDLPPEVNGAAWRSHELRVSAATAVIAGFVLPMLLGCLGGCAYALRRLDNKLTTWTLEPHDGKHALVRVCLAALLGGLVGVVWTSDESIKLGGLTLSLAAAAFFIGFAVEAVFKVIETLIATVTAGMQVPTVVPQVAARLQPIAPVTPNSVVRPQSGVAVGEPQRALATGQSESPSKTESPPKS